MLTWQADVVFTFDSDLKQVSQQGLWEDAKEGWGITSKADKLYVSDGTQYLTVVDSLEMETLN